MIKDLNIFERGVDRHIAALDPGFRDLATRPSPEQSGPPNANIGAFDDDHGGEDLVLSHDLLPEGDEPRSGVDHQPLPSSEKELKGDHGELNDTVFHGPLPAIFGMATVILTATTIIT